MITTTHEEEFLTFHEAVLYLEGFLRDMGDDGSVVEDTSLYYSTFRPLWSVRVVTKRGMKPAEQLDIPF